MNITLSVTVCVVSHTRPSGTYDYGNYGRYLGALRIFKVIEMNRTPLLHHSAPLISLPDLLIGWKSDGKREHGP